MDLIKLFRLIQLIESSFSDGKISPEEAASLISSVVDIFSNK